MKKVGVLLGIVILLAVTAYAQQWHPAEEIKPTVFNNNAGGIFKFISNTLTDYYKFYIGPAAQEQSNTSNTFSVKIANSTHYCEEFIYPDLIWSTCNGTNGTIQGGGGTGQVTNTPGFILIPGVSNFLAIFFNINILIFDDFNWEQKIETDPGTGTIYGTVNFKDANGGGTIHVSADGSAAGTYVGTIGGTAGITSSVQSGSSSTTITQTSSTVTIDTPTGTLEVDGNTWTPKDAAGNPIPGSSVNIGENPANLGTALFGASVGSSSSSATAGTTSSIDANGGSIGSTVSNPSGGTMASNSKSIAVAGYGVDTMSTYGPNGFLNTQVTQSAMPGDANMGFVGINTYDTTGTVATSIQSGTNTVTGDSYIQAAKYSGGVEVAGMKLDPGSLILNTPNGTYSYPTPGSYPIFTPTDFAQGGWGVKHVQMWVCDITAVPAAAVAGCNAYLLPPAMPGLTAVIFELTFPGGGYAAPAVTPCKARGDPAGVVVCAGW